MNAVGDDYTLSTSLTDSVGMDNVGVAGTQSLGYLHRYATDRVLIEASADGRLSKRLQKVTTDGTLSSRRPAADTSVPSSSELKSNFGSRRRQSVRDQKLPQPASALHPSPSKR